MNKKDWIVVNREQVRMARAALNWGVRDLAAKADVATNTISRYENGADMMAATLTKVVKVLEAEGIDFPDEFTVSIRRLKEKAE
jgi:transcriptional regulator with XRE-family HTH domain